MLRLLAALTVAASLGCAHAPIAGPGFATGANDAAEIYRAFLEDWTGRKKDSVNVSRNAEAPPADALEEFSDCANEAQWSPVEPIDDLSSLLGDLTYVRLIDPDKWSALDPRDLIAQGQPIEDAVAAGMDNGLVTLSAIAFDESRNTAAFSFSFACGSLCGSGRTVVYMRTPAGWTELDTQCGNWISQIPGGRSNNSFKEMPVRGNA